MKCGLNLAEKTEINESKLIVTNEDDVQVGKKLELQQGTLVETALTHVP